MKTIKPVPTEVPSKASTPSKAVPPTPPKTPEAILRSKLNALYPDGWQWRARPVNAANRDKATVHGHGVNDADYMTQVTVNGKLLTGPPHMNIC